MFFSKTTGKKKCISEVVRVQETFLSFCFGLDDFRALCAEKSKESCTNKGLDENFSNQHHHQQEVPQPGLSKVKVLWQSHLLPQLSLQIPSQWTATSWAATTRGRAQRLCAGDFKASYLPGFCTVRWAGPVIYLPFTSQQPVLTHYSSCGDSWAPAAHSNDTFFFLFFPPPSAFPWDIFLLRFLSDICVFVR